MLSRLRENLTPRSVSGNILHVFIVTKLVLQGFANYRMLSLVPAEPQSFRFCFFLLVLVPKLLAVQTTEWYNNNFCRTPAGVRPRNGILGLVLGI